jgi:hypothetical protein
MVVTPDNEMSMTGAQDLKHALEKRGGPVEVRRISRSGEAVTGVKERRRRPLLKARTSSLKPLASAAERRS